MPGIVGLITGKPRDWAEPQVLQMIEALRHEPFYEIGTWADESLGVYVGWAALKNSFCAEMPVYNEKRDVVLVFSGEDYPDSGTASRLRQQGHQFETEGPSYLVHLYESDPGFPSGLNGRFQGVLADRSQGKVILFNDRFGMHRIYCHESKEAFYFAAEAKAIIKVRPALRRVDPRSLGEFVACGSVLENRSLFEGLRVLPSGSAWVFRNGSVDRKDPYFRPQEWEQQSLLEPKAYYQKLREVLATNLPRYFNGRQRIGMSLTGGLDTRVVMAWQGLSPGTLPCYTYGGMFRECRDVQVARRVAGACQQPHQTITVGDAFLSRFARYAERSVYLSEGCIDLSRSPDLYVSEKAREIAPVRMTGLYGDEVLRHLRAFKAVQPAPGLFSHDFLPYVNQGQSTYTEMLRVHPLSFAVFRQAPWHHRGILALEETQITARTPFLDNDFVRTVFRAPKSAFNDNEIRLRLIGDGNPVLRSIGTDRGFAGNGDGFSTAAFRNFLNFLFKAEYAYDYGMPQWLARVDHLLSPMHLERLFLGRHKLYHFRVWYRDALSTYVREMLLDSRTLSRPYIERKQLENVVLGHLNGTRNYTTEIHKVLTLELLHRLFID